MRSDAIKIGTARGPHRSLLKADGLTDEDKPWSFAAVAGALMFAHSHYERKSLFDGFFKGLFK